MTSRVWVRAITIAAGSGLMIATALGQGRGVTPPSTGTGSTGTTGGAPTTTTRPTTTTPTTPQPTQQQPTIQQPIYVAGRVMLEDGSPPPEIVTIETVCNGSPHG